ncbi:hypothetical protein G6F46_013508 [Rhizopus delemar]|nr:hypothetical protein G6F46_013508 [Rhizopus delemar]
MIDGVKQNTNDLSAPGLGVVPLDQVERVEIVRGSGSVQYGGGTTGGVVNIITKRPTGDLTGAVDLYGLVPEHSAEGGSERVGLQLSGPMTDTLSFRLYGTLNKTAADSLDLNRQYATNPNAVPPAGREGVKHRDVNALLRWDLTADQVVEFEAGTSRQGNIYAGDRAVSTTGTSTGVDLAALADGKAETLGMYRNTGAITHRGRWGDVTSRLTAAVEAAASTAPTGRPRACAITSWMAK